MAKDTIQGFEGLWKFDDGKAKALIRVTGWSLRQDAEAPKMLEIEGEVLELSDPAVQVAWLETLLPNRGMILHLVQMTIARNPSGGGITICANGILKEKTVEAVNVTTGAFLKQDETMKKVASDIRKAFAIPDWEMSGPGRFSGLSKRFGRIDDDDS